MKVSIIALLFSAVPGWLCAQDTTRISLLFAGDVMGHDSQIASAYDPIANAYDYASCFQFMKPYVALADVAIANLEVTLAGPPYTGYPQFSSPDSLAQALKNLGFDVLVTANNHCIDRGKPGLERTIEMLDNVGIAHTGTFVDTVSRMNDSPLFIEENGFRLAILNYTYGTNGIAIPKSSIVNLLDTALMKLDIAKARENKPDVIIIFAHWGFEYQSQPSRNQKELTEFCFKQGVQLVIGAHPHVIQPMEWRKEKNQFVAYSLGNFVSGQRKRYTDGGAMAYVELEKITYTPDSARTIIDKAGYYLHWVYRTADVNKDYYLIPAAKVKSDSISFIKDKNSSASFRLFVDDSRLLNQKYSRGVIEMTEPPRTFARKPTED